MAKKTKDDDATEETTSEAPEPTAEATEKASPRFDPNDPRDAALGELYGDSYKNQ